jgi:hypothetical protein
VTNIWLLSSNIQLKYLFSVLNTVKYKYRNSEMEKLDVVIKSGESLRSFIFLINIISNASLYMGYLKDCYEGLIIFLND